MLDIIKSKKSLNKSTNNYSNVSAISNSRVKAVSAGTKIFQNGTSRFVKVGDVISLNNSGAIRFDKNGSIKLEYGHNNYWEFSGRSDIDLKSLRAHTFALAAIISVADKKIQNRIYSQTIVLIFILVFSFFVSLWFLLCYHRNAGVFLAFFWGCLGILAFIMLYKTLSSGVLNDHKLAMALSGLVFPVLFLISMLILRKNNLPPEMEKIEDAASVFLYDGFILYKTNKFTEALEKFKKASALQPEKKISRRLLSFLI